MSGTEPCRDISGSSHLPLPNLGTGTEVKTKTLGPSRKGPARPWISLHLCPEPLSTILITPHFPSLTGQDRQIISQRFTENCSTCWIWASGGQAVKLGTKYSKGMHLHREPSLFPLLDTVDRWAFPGVLLRRESLGGVLLSHLFLDLSHTGVLHAVFPSPFHLG